MPALAIGKANNEFKLKNRKMRKSQLTLSIEKSILEILQSKDECQTAFQLNKYIFFIYAVKSTVDFNSHDLYKLLKLKNNAAGATIKRNLIEWGIINQTSGVSFQQHSNGTFKANNNSRYKIDTKFMFDKKVDYVMVSDKAKFINHPAIYHLTDGLIVEAIKERKQRKPKTSMAKPEHTEIKPLVEIKEVEQQNHSTTELLAKNGSKIKLIDGNLYSELVKQNLAKIYNPVQKTLCVRDEKRNFIWFTNNDSVVAIKTA